MRVRIVDPPAYTPPYDHALCAALAKAGAEVELVTSRFPYAEVTQAAPAYAVTEHFYRRSAGPAGSRRRRLTRLAEHVPDMVRLRRAVAHTPFPRVTHFQWLSVPQLDVRLLPRGPLVLTAHDLLPREPRPGQLAAQRRLLERVDAVIVHSIHGRGRLLAATGLDPVRVHVVPHGVFTHLVTLADPAPLPADLAGVTKPVVLCFGLLRPYKGLDVLLDAWAELGADAELWIVGRPRYDIGPARARADRRTVRFVDRFIADREIPALFSRSDVVVLPYRATDRFDQSGVLFTALAFGRPTVLTEIGGFPEVAATGAAALVPPDDPGALAAALGGLLDDPERREQLAAAARRAAAGPYSWAAAARATLAVYDAVQPSEWRA